MFKKLIGITAALTLLFGCGGNGSSGVDGAKQATDLTSAEVQEVCAWASEIIVKKVASCSEESVGDGEIASNTQECVAQINNLSADTCSLSVSEAEACVNAIDDVSCDLNEAQVVTALSGVCSTFANCGLLDL